MPLQNRVTPFGEIVSHPARGMFMGNRGVLHDDAKTLGRRRWMHKAWIACLTEFRGWRRPVMAPRCYTELFFMDEAVALAAGHRPCALCRRDAFRAFLTALDDGAIRRAPALDQRLHSERIDPRTRRQGAGTARLGDLPDGAMVVHGDEPARAHLWWSGALHAWAFDGYGPPVAPDRSATVRVLTPATTLAALHGGYRPVLHPILQT